VGFIGAKERDGGKRSDEGEWVLLMVCKCANAPSVKKKKYFIFERPS
jgi:hypothetical protein